MLFLTHAALKFHDAYSFSFFLPDAGKSLIDVALLVAVVFVGRGSQAEQ